HSFLFDFYILDFERFDFILGLDWLSKFEAKIKCSKRTVTLTTNLGRKAKIWCKRPERGSCNFLNAIEIVEEGSLETIEVVRDFADVFEEVRDLPPHREIEFKIDLIPGARP
ncbi:hypothetical protein RBK84_00460, partial [Pseudomonas aeruginosa]|uniref:hypothetical protein n=1 Tax=Pseudomonas aeruginosa TaxID=287 RepID=UPI0027D38C67